MEETNNPKRDVEIILDVAITFIITMALLIGVITISENWKEVKTLEAEVVKFQAVVQYGIETNETDQYWDYRNK